MPNYRRIALGDNLKQVGYKAKLDANGDLVIKIPLKHKMTPNPTPNDPEQYTYRDIDTDRPNIANGAIEIFLYGTGATTSRLHITADIDSKIPGTGGVAIASKSSDL
jgi:hypothetical protein